MKIKGEKALKVSSVILIVAGVLNVLLSLNSMCTTCELTTDLLELNVFHLYLIAIILAILGGAMEIASGTYACTIFQNTDKKKRIRITIILGIITYVVVFLANFSTFYFYSQLHYSSNNTASSGLIIIFLFIISAVRVRFGYRSIAPEEYGKIKQTDNDEDIVDN